MIHTTATIEKELRRIQASIPKPLLQFVVTETAITPTMKDVVDKALEDPDFPAEKKEELRILKANGYFDRKKVRQNDNIAKQIDNYVNREIKKAVKDGRLPTKKQLKEIQLHEKK